MGVILTKEEKINIAKFVMESHQGITITEAKSNNNIREEIKSNFEYFQTVKKTFMLGTLNNTGRYLKMSNTYKYLNKNFILRCFEIFGLKKRVNPTS